MNGIENPTLQEGIAEFTESSKQPTRIGLLKKSHRNAERLIRCETSGNSGNIVVNLEKSDMPMLVNTGTGALVNKEREIITERLSACAYVFIQSPNFNFPVHMTPSTELSYYNSQFRNGAEITQANVKKIIGLMPEGTEKDKCTATITVCMANESDDKYDYRQVYPVWDRLKKALQDQGIPQVKIVELPLDEITLYFSPDKPNSMTALGYPTKLTADGKYDIDRNTIEQIDFSLDPNVQETFVSNRPIIKTT